MDEFEVGATVRVNEDTQPAAIAGQVCRVLKKVRGYPNGDAAYMISVAHPHHNELVYFGSELTLLKKGSDEKE